MIARRFNIAGACNPEKHYMLPPEGRLPEVNGLIAQEAYFVIHAPRQSGKTTAMRALAQRLTEEGAYAGLYFSCEQARAFPEDVSAAERAIWSSIKEESRYSLPELLQPPPEISAGPGTLLRVQLTAWAERCPKPLVLIFDEIDAVEGSSLKSVLSQLRAGYLSRTKVPFPHSVILCGVRDVRDYKAASGGDSGRIGSSSPFNIKTESLRLGNFSEAEVRTLYGQHTEATGQVFSEEALLRAWDLCQGQPWLANALAREVVEKIGVPPDQSITDAHIEAAKERLIRVRATHLDSLLSVLQEDRVRRVLEPVLTGGFLKAESLDDDLRYVVDLGLLTDEKPPKIANGLYREVIFRVLADPVEYNLTADPRRFVLADGRLDIDTLLSEFAHFWIQHGEILAKGLGYQEAAPHLVLMAWLHKIVNGGGFIEREVGIGTERIDLLVRWPYAGAGGVRQWQTAGFEIKARRDSDKGKFSPDAAIGQIDAYLDRLGLDTGVLALFDDRTKAPAIHKRTRLEKRTTPGGRAITLFLG